MHGLCGSLQLHLRVFSSGSTAESAQVIVAKNFDEVRRCDIQLQHDQLLSSALTCPTPSTQVLEESMFKLHLTSPVKRVFTCNGKQVGEER